MIIYNQPRNLQSDDTEGHIAHAIKQIPTDLDIYLFHKTYNPPEGFKGLKVCWYFDKLWKDRPEWMKDILEKVDYVFMSDETWARNNPHPKIRIMRQGIGDRDVSLGNKTGRYKGKIAFLGSVYGERALWASKLKERYGSDFQAYNSVFNRDLYDLCADIPIIIAPEYPSDDYYWSNRIYLTLGSGGFMIHPHLKGLDREYIDGEHYVSYTDFNDMCEKIDYYLANPQERNDIRLKGYNKTITSYTYTTRWQEILKEIQAHQSIGQGE